MTHRPAGIWLLPPHVCSSSGSLAALQRDFVRVRALDHPHIARLQELGCKGQQYYVTGERLDGETLRDVLTHLLPERLDVAESDEVVRAVGAALVYAHEHGVPHGDVRAENVLVTMDRRFVLTNFLARRVAKVAARPPLPADDVRGLARLAAELYTGTPSTQFGRGAALAGVPAARLSAIRAVFESSSRRKTTVAEFLESAGLVARNPSAKARRSPPQRRGWSIWRLVVPVAAVVTVGGVLALREPSAYAWRDSAVELQQRSVDALLAMTGRVQSPSPGAPAVKLESAPPADAAALAAERAEPEPAAPTAATAEAPAPSPEPSSPAAEPAVLSFGVARVAVREDGAVVAIEVVRSGDLSQPATVSWWLTPDTAHADEDYAGLARQTLAFAAGVDVARVLVPLVNDGVPEASEMFTVHLGRPQGATAGRITAARVTLHDDD